MRVLDHDCARQRAEASFQHSGLVERYVLEVCREQLTADDVGSGDEVGVVRPAGALECRRRFDRGALSRSRIVGNALLLGSTPLQQVTDAGHVVSRPYSRAERLLEAPRGGVDLTPGCGGAVELGDPVVQALALARQRVAALDLVAKIFGEFGEPHLC
ncbi:MAG TPA: hypothetical protein VFG69_16360, partial [Nannocystaceae bacterium]|nr:hypothetical protein [Nannocystaceae bacterium]